MIFLGEGWQGYAMGEQGDGGRGTGSWLQREDILK